MSGSSTAKCEHDKRLGKLHLVIWRPDENCDPFDSHDIEDWKENDEGRMPLVEDFMTKTCVRSVVI